MEIYTVEDDIAHATAMFMGIGALLVLTSALAGALAFGAVVRVVRWLR